MNRLRGFITEKKASFSSPIKDKDEQNINEYQSAEFGIDRSNQGSSFAAFFNIVCVVAGTGALGLPYALALGGWIDTALILVRSMYYDGQKRLGSYQEIAEEAFGKIGGWLSFFFTSIILVGVPVLYLLLSGQNLHTVAQGTSAELTFPIWTIICTAICAAPYLFFRNLKEISLLGIFGMLSTVVVILIVLGVAVQEAPDHVGVHHDNVIWNMFPIALSSISFSFGGNPVYPHIEGSMRNRHHWFWTITASLSFCLLIYFLAAVPGYYVYGVAAKSPIYDSLSNTYKAPKFASIIIITIHLILTTPILLTSFSIDVEKMLKINPEHRSFFVEWGLRFLLRGCLIVAICVIAVFVPFFGDFMSLLGAFANCAVVFLLPVIFYYKLTGIRGKAWWDYVLAVLTILIGVVGLIFGTISSIEALNRDFHSQKS
ncbi:transmembrane amino acid transporter protein-domain-containing protein [Mycotypha africana]|uniref:transmembrane amino acid transporter protein-domain-containing protein n=1 Tax=Mycotypha africana TaxID=64632 RepID=UPI002301D1C0|nr:transmembrane amino acid transporter protein-domain-containing protein [Mycotypha africana]KAI8987699.1 transmembrane amino acid transporter protein-domain-containing protein [Mycotypha africana]